MTAPALLVDGLHVEIGRTPILRDVCLELPAGSMAGLIGRNGAGKTTLLRSIMGLLTLGAAQGTTITVIAQGADAEACLEAISGLVAARFGEDE